MGLFRPRLLTPLLLAAIAATATVRLPRAQPAEPPATSATPEPSGTSGVPSPVAVRFTEPKPPYVLLGDTRIAVEAVTAPGARIERVEIFADDHLLSVLENPPYHLTWNAGRATGSLTLRAVAIDSLGRRGEAVLPTRPILIGQREEVRLVNVYASVRDRRGRAVEGLSRDDFSLLEDGVPQTISHFAPARGSLAVALLIDASNSMNLGGRIDMARKAADDFLDAVGTDDRLLVLHFNDDVFGADEPSSDRRGLREAIAGVAARGGTALYDAVYRTSDRLARLEGQKAIVLLSDGRDQALTENEPGSLHLFEEALERASRAEVAVYAVGLGRRLDTEMDLRGERSLQEILSTLARQTGGRYYEPEKPGQLSGIYKEIAADLKSQYALAYSPTSKAQDGRWRTITLRVRDPQLRVRARAGYYAPGTASR